MLKILALTFFGAALLIAIGVLSKDLFHKRKTHSDSKKAALPSLSKQAGPELKVDYMKENHLLAAMELLEEYEKPSDLERLLKHLQWQEQQTIRNSLQEDWSEMEAKFPVTNGTFDLRGRPIFYFDLGLCTVANFLAEGGSTERFLRYIVKVFEESDVQVRQLRSQGKDVSQYVWILKLADCNITREECVESRQFYQCVGRMVFQYFPSIVKSYFTLRRFVPEMFSLIKFFENKFPKFSYSEIKDETHEIHIYFDRDQRQSKLVPIWPQGQN